MAIAAVVVAMLLLAAACGDDDDPPDAATDVVESPTPAEVTPTPAEESVPAELIGEWVTTFAPGDTATLTIGDGSWQLERGAGPGGGRMRVRGDEIHFLTSNRCEGVGTYRWALAADMLTLTPVGADPCGRSEGLANRTFARK